MPRRLARATCWIALALLAAGCVEIHVRRTIAPDRSGRQTLRMRAPKGAPAQSVEGFPGSFSGATVLPTRKQADGDAVVYTADIEFADVTRVRHRAGFLHSSATIEPTKAGTLLYRESLGNGYLNSLAKAPDAKRKEALAAEILKTRAALEKAQLAYTISFPGKIVKSNADRVSGSEATWLLAVDKLFQHRTLDLTAEYRTAPEPVVASRPVLLKLAAPAREPVTAPALAPRPAPPVLRSEPKPLAAPAARREPKLDGMLLAQADEAKPVTAPALAPRPAPPVLRSEPKPLAAPAARREPKLDGMLLAQADEAKPEAKAAPPAKPELPKPKPEAATLDDEAADDKTTREVKALFGKALGHLDRKEYEQAAKLLQDAIALKPDSVVVANLYNVAVARFIDAAMEGKDPKLKAAAEKLLQIAKKGRIEQLRQPAYVQQLVKSLSEGFLPRTFAMEELILAGDYAVPHLIDYIQKNEDARVRAYAAHVLSNLGAIAVPAICECLKCPDPIIRQIIVQALEAIGDPRAVPMLLAIAQDPKGHPLVVNSARKAIAKIAKDPAIFQTHSPLAFLTLAERYYEHDRRVLLPHLYEHLVWRWDYDKKALTSESVPAPLYPYRMCEEACRNALLAEPSFEPAIPLIVCTYFAQQNFLADFFTSVQGKKLTPELAKEVELAKPIAQRLRHAPLVAHASGKKFVYAALRRSLRDGRTDVAVSCINALEQIADGAALPKPPVPEEEALKANKKAGRAKGKRGRLITWWGPKPDEKPEEPEPAANPYAVLLDGTPLIEALGYAPHRKVRYRAAEAIVAINPHHEILDGEKVLIDLSEALAETVERVALLVDDDETRADQIRGLLRDCAVAPVLARTQRDAIRQGKALPPKDLLVLSSNMKGLDIADLLTSLRRIDSLAAKPAIIVTTKGDLPALRKRLAKEGVAFLTTPFDKRSIQNVVEEVLAKAPEPKGQGASVVYASSAARTLASIDPATSVFKLQQALPALLRAVATGTQPDEVRIPATRAVQHARAPRALPYLVNTYKDPKSSKPLRLALLEAIGACAAPLPAPPKDVVAVLSAAAAHKDFDYRAAAAKAFGLAGGAAGDIIPVIDQLHGKKPNIPPRK